MKNNLLNRVVALTATFIILLSTCLSAYAADEVKEPRRWSYMVSCSDMFIKSAEYANYDVFGCGGSTMTRSGYYAYVYVELDRLVNGYWRYYDSWEDEGYMAAATEEYIPVTPGYTYRLVLRFEARDANGNTLEYLDDESNHYLASYSRN